jgi:hypothetical protein
MTIFVNVVRRGKEPVLVYLDQSKPMREALIRRLNDLPEYKSKPLPPNTVFYGSADEAYPVTFVDRGTVYLEAPARTDKLSLLPNSSSSADPQNVAHVLCVLEDASAREPEFLRPDEKTICEQEYLFDDVCTFYYDTLGLAMTLQMHVSLAAPGVGRKTYRFSFKETMTEEQARAVATLIKALVPHGNVHVLPGTEYINQKNVYFAIKPDATGPVLNIKWEDLIMSSIYICVFSLDTDSYKLPLSRVFATIMCGVARNHVQRVEYCKLLSFWRSKEMDASPSLLDALKASFASKGGTHVRPEIFPSIYTSNLNWEKLEMKYVIRNETESDSFIVGIVTKNRHYRYSKPCITIYFRLPDSKENAADFDTVVRGLWTTYVASSTDVASGDAAYEAKLRPVSITGGGSYYDWEFEPGNAHFSAHHDKFKATSFVFAILRRLSFLTSFVHESIFMILYADIAVDAPVSAYTPSSSWEPESERWKRTVSSSHAFKLFADGFGMKTTTLAACLRLPPPQHLDDMPTVESRVLALSWPGDDGKTGGSKRPVPKRRTSSKRRRLRSRSTYSTRSRRSRRSRSKQHNRRRGARR